jgi:hypothetical protein
VVQALVSDLRRPRREQGKGGWKGATRLRQAGVESEKPWEERAKANKGSGAGRAIVGVRSPRRLRRSSKSRPLKVGK